MRSARPRRAPTLTVTDSTGKVVYTTAGETAPGQHDFTWNGKDSNGNQLADGAYTLTVDRDSRDGTAVTTAVASKGVVERSRSDRHRTAC